MSVSVRIPTILRSYTGGAAEVFAADGSLREVIASLEATYPGIGERILDDAGKLRRFVNVYVGDEDVRFTAGLDTPVPAGTQVSVIPAVAGGALPATSRLGRIHLAACPRVTRGLTFRALAAPPRTAQLIELSRWRVIPHYSVLATRYQR